MKLILYKNISTFPVASIASKDSDDFESSSSKSSSSRISTNLSNSLSASINVLKLSRRVCLRCWHTEPDNDFADPHECNDGDCVLPEIF